MQYFDRDYLQMMRAAGQSSPTAGMPQQQQQQLETMYPKTYNMISPVVENLCDNMTANNGMMHTLSPDQMNSMVDEVYKKVEPNIEAEVSKDERQFFGGGRRLLRDFIGALLITSLIRRRRPFYGYPGYGYPGYGYPGYGYPGYYGGGYGGGFGYDGGFGGYPY